MEKEKLNKDKSIELRSEELQDLIGRMPFCFERYGIIVLAAIVLIIISGTYFFKYPDTLDAQIVITNSTPAANIVARTAGNLEYINTNNGGIVAVGEVLAVIANTANYKDVIQLENVIEKVEVQEMNIEEFVSWMNTNMLRLGNMQHYYVTLHNAARNLYYYNVNNYYQKKTKLFINVLSSIMKWKTKNTTYTSYKKGWNRLVMTYSCAILCFIFLVCFQRRHTARRSKYICKAVEDLLTVK